MLHFKLINAAYFILLRCPWEPLHQSKISFLIIPHCYVIKKADAREDIRKARYKARYKNTTSMSYWAIIILDDFYFNNDKWE